MGEDIPNILPPYHPLTEMYPQTAERTDPCSVTEPKPNQWTKPTNSLFFLLHVVLRNILYFYIRYNIQFGLISQNKKRGRHTINILLHHAVLACKGWPWLSIQEYYISYPLYKKKLYILSKKKKAFGTVVLSKMPTLYLFTYCLDRVHQENCYNKYSYLIKKNKKLSCLKKIFIILKI